MLGGVNLCGQDIRVSLITELRGLHDVPSFQTSKKRLAFSSDNESDSDEEDTSIPGSRR